MRVQRGFNVGSTQVLFFWLWMNTVVRSSEEKIKTCRVQNPDIPRAGRGGAAHGAAAGPGWAGPEGMSTVRLAQETSVPRTHKGTEGNCP